MSHHRRALCLKFVWTLTWWCSRKFLRQCDEVSWDFLAWWMAVVICLSLLTEPVPFEKTYLLLWVMMERARRDGFVKEVILSCGYKVPLISRNLFYQVDNSWFTLRVSNANQLHLVGCLLSTRVRIRRWKIATSVATTIIALLRVSDILHTHIHLPSSNPTPVSL